MSCCCAYASISLRLLFLEQKNIFLAQIRHRLLLNIIIIVSVYGRTQPSSLHESKSKRPHHDAPNNIDIDAYYLPWELLKYQMHWRISL